jgi:hypothetical protein
LKFFAGPAGSPNRAARDVFDQGAIPVRRHDFLQAKHPTKGQIMPKITAQIEDIERKMEQHRNRLRGLKAQATKQERKDDTRRKLLYGAAYLCGLETLTADARQRSLDRVESHITRPKDREFLGLAPLPAMEEMSKNAEPKDEGGTANLPFPSSSDCK